MPALTLALLGPPLVTRADGGAVAFRSRKHLALLAYLAVEQRRCHRDVAFIGEPVADVADVIVDSENLLDDDDAALRRALRIGAVGAEAVAVGGGEREMLAQGGPPNV